MRVRVRGGKAAGDEGQRERRENAAAGEERGRNAAGAHGERERREEGSGR